MQENDFEKNFENIQCRVNEPSMPGDKKTLERIREAKEIFEERGNNKGTVTEKDIIEHRNKKQSNEEQRIKRDRILKELELDEICELENKINNNNNKMKRNFSLTRTINSIIEHKQLSETDRRTIDQGIANAQRLGLDIIGQIVLPLENRDITDKTGHGQETIGTDVLNILEPIRNNLILKKLGANFHTVNSHIQVTDYSGTTQNWQNETQCVSDTSGTFTANNYQPLRLCAMVNVSKMLLKQDESGTEQMLIRDLSRAISEKLEQTIFSNAQAVADFSPPGIFNQIPQITISDWQDTVAIETSLRQNNYNGTIKYQLNPYVFGQLSTLPKAENTAVFAIENNLLNSNQVEVSNSVLQKSGVCGDWSQFNVFFWNNVNIVVDQITRANCGEVRLIANLYVNAGIRNSNAFATFNMQ